MPDVATVAGVPVRTSAYRDYSPRIVGPDEFDKVFPHPVSVHVSVVAPGDAQLPRLRPERIAVFCVDEVWTTHLHPR